MNEVYSLRNLCSKRKRLKTKVNKLEGELKEGKSLLARNIDKGKGEDEEICFLQGEVNI